MKTQASQVRVIRPSWAATAPHRKSVTMGHIIWQSAVPLGLLLVGAIIATGKHML
jgi:hypothetical protein